jgi:luciferase family oxidoreductase group 1
MTTELPPLSVLDLATVGTGQSSSEALAATTEVARRAETLGYRRLWVAEHHNMPAVASTSPPVLVAHLAAHTSRLRVGSGGVMLPNHAPFVVGEQFAMLEALYPGRIDLGIGRAPGTDPATAAALRRSPDALGAEDFPRHLLDLMAMLGDPRTPDGVDRLAPTPAPRSRPRIFLLGSSGFSAQLAGALGLPFAFAHHFAGDNTVAAVQLYRSTFRPSTVLDEPYVVVTAAALVAPTDDEAHFLAGPSRMMLLSLRTGRLGPLLTPGDAAAHPQRDLAEQLPSSHVIGSPATVVPRLAGLAADTGADELMIATTTHGLAERLRSLELLAGAWGVDPGDADGAWAGVRSGWGRGA